jgi:hypothetical protein
MLVYPSTYRKHHQQTHQYLNDANKVTMTHQLFCKKDTLLASMLHSHHNGNIKAHNT